MGKEVVAPTDKKIATLKLYITIYGDFFIIYFNTILEKYLIKR